jgi:hypothetical protein
MSTVDGTYACIQSYVQTTAYRPLSQRTHDVHDGECVCVICEVEGRDEQRVSRVDSEPLVARVVEL